MKLLAIYDLDFSTYLLFGHLVKLLSYDSWGDYMSVINCIASSHLHNLHRLEKLRLLKRWNCSWNSLCDKY